MDGYIITITAIIIIFLLFRYCLRKPSIAVENVQAEHVVKVVLENAKTKPVSKDVAENENADSKPVVKVLVKKQESTVKRSPPKQSDISDLSDTQYSNNPRELHRTKSTMCLLERTQRQVSVLGSLPHGAASSSPQDDADVVEKIAELNYDITQREATISHTEVTEDFTKSGLEKTLVQTTAGISPSPSKSRKHYTVEVPLPLVTSSPSSYSPQSRMRAIRSTQIGPDASSSSPSEHGKSSNLSDYVTDSQSGAQSKQNQSPIVVVDDKLSTSSSTDSNSAYFAQGLDSDKRYPLGKAEKKDT